MDKLISELVRLYLPAHPASAAAFAQHLDGQTALPLAAPDGMVRAAALPFPLMPDQAEGHHWHRLCEVASNLQSQAGFPAPAVSIQGDGSYCLWLSLESAVPAAQMAEFTALLQQAYMVDMADMADIPPRSNAAFTLPPSLDTVTGKWNAFIHPGMGASFADGSGLEVAPPLAGQAAFLDGLRSIGAAQFAEALAKLRRPAADSASTAASTEKPRAAPDGLLLKDATLEDIVQYLHAKNIEPTFRFRQFRSQD